MYSIRNIKIHSLFCLLFMSIGFHGVVFANDINFDNDWKFSLLKDGNSIQDISTWRDIDLPHDWSIEGRYSLDNGDWQNGFLPCGIGIYKKTFNLSDTYKDKLVNIRFDGVYRCSDVWINGNHLGYRPNGFLGFEYDLTPYLKQNNNVLIVKVDHSKHLSNRSYTGSGIYRHVWLNITDKMHIPMSGIKFTYSDVLSRSTSYLAQITIKNNYLQRKKCKVILDITDNNGKTVANGSNYFSLNKKDSSEVKITGKAENLKLWSPASPYLYNLKISICIDKKVVNTYSQKIGFRDIKFSANNGFILNGERLKIKGVCERATAGALGSAVPDNILLSRIKMLKDMGCNAIRTCHHPFAPEFYTICDSLGIMVMDEMFDGWETPKSRDDYGIFFNDWWERDVTDFVKRDRNHPSVIMWSIGNEVVNPTRKTQQKIIAKFKSLDNTRFITQGGCDPTRGMEGDELETILDVKGFNGDGEEKGVFADFHHKFPNTPIIGTEVPHTLHTRGIYRTKTQWRKFDFPAIWEQRNKTQISKEEYLKKMYPIPDLTQTEVFGDELCDKYYMNGKYYPINNELPRTMYYQSSYDNASVRISAWDSWKEVENNDYLSGTFRWTGYDYLGESNGWPSRFMNCGVIDICGFPKDHYYLYQSLWSTTPMAHILPHWFHKGKEGEIIPVVVYTNAQEAELFLNGISLGKKTISNEILKWDVPYSPGTIMVKAYNNGKVAATDKQQTAENAAALRLNPFNNTTYSSNNDVIPISVEIVDKHGVLCPKSDNNIHFEVTGGGSLLRVDNGDPIDLSDYTAQERKAFRGLAMLWVKPNGLQDEIIIKAKSAQLKSDSISIKRSK